MDDKCLICTSKNWDVFCSIESDKYDVLICKTCSFCCLSPIPTEQDLNDFYARKYRKECSKQDVVTDKVIAYEQQRADRVISVIADLFSRSFKNILDIGCSSGTLLQNVAQLADNPNLHGVEMNDNYRKYIIEQGLVPATNLSNDDINKYFNGRERQFDFISIVHVLEHLRNPKATLDSIYKLLSSEGRLYIEVPNMKTPYNNLRTEYLAMYHLYNFTDYTLRELLVKSGFKVLKEQQVARTSVCFVCEKGELTNVKEVYDAEEYNKLINALHKYERVYPLKKMQVLGIKCLTFLKLKKVVVKALNVLGIKNY